MSYYIQSEDLDVGGLKEVELRLKYTLTHSSSTISLPLKTDQRTAKKKKNIWIDDISKIAKQKAMDPHSPYRHTDSATIPRLIPSVRNPDIN